ncbi:hypothetical protein ACH4TX_12260 [Streptomyces sp. NPDC021098]|uniref:hypothetical protein n=1 Tax=unclassified Streptomyces TaxID=2593676 RepID=UPI003798D6FE
MSQDYAHFLKRFRVQEGDRVAENLWRRDVRTGHWQFLSFWDWEWHEPTQTMREHGSPDVESLQPVSVEQANDLEKDRARWFLYWAVYRSEPNPGDEPVNVARKRPSPESGRDEIFGTGDEWMRTTKIFDFYSPWPTDPPHLEPVDAAEAERILQERRGVTGATSW